MPSCFAFIAVCALCVSTVFAQSPDSRTFFVATDGNDAWSGKLDRANEKKTDGPFATIARARDAVRTATTQPRTQASRGTVFIRGGTYFLTETLTFDERDSRSAYLRAYNEQPIISGGRPITGFKATPEGLWVAEVPQAKDGKWPFNEMFVNGQRRPRARHPNDGYLRVVKAVDKRTSFTFNPGDVPDIKNVKTTELVFLHDWAISRIDVAEIDRQANTLKTADPIGATTLGFTVIDGFEAHPRYFLENAIEFIDAPGEWFLDTATGTLTYKPMPGETIEKAEVIAPFLTRLVTVAPDKSGPVVYLDFIGLTFEHCLFVRPAHGYAASQAGFHEARGPGQKGYRPMTAAIEVFNSELVSLHECTVRHLGGSGVRFHPSCRHCNVALSTFDDIGGNGIMVGGEGKLTEAAPAKFFRIRKNEIAHCGQRFFGCVGIWAGIAHSAQIADNLVGGMPYSGISVGWSWNVNPTGAGMNYIERNHIHHVMRTLSDGGGIYTLGRQDGTVIRNNLIHDIPANAGRAESNGMFIDEGSSQMTIAGNLIYNVARSPIRFHKATTNTIRDNTLVAPKGVPTFRFNACKESDFTFERNKTPDLAMFTPPDPKKFFDPPTTQPDM